MPQTKDKDWLNGYKNKTPIYAVYKRTETLFFQQILKDILYTGDTKTVYKLKPKTIK